MSEQTLMLDTNVLNLNLDDLYIGSPYSPRVDISEISGGHEVAITSKKAEGITTDTFDVLDGTNAYISGATASVNNNVGIPSVDVINGGTPSNRSFEFIFSNLKGNKGDNAYIDSATASVDNHVGIPGVEVITGGTPSNRTFDFIFTNLKGDKGDKGDNAYIDSAIASVDNTVGTPSVEVISGGTAIHRTFEFIFSHLKGEQGIQGIQGPKGDNAYISGATASVDNTVGTPSVEIISGGTPSNRTFEFIFSHLKGEKGDNAYISGATASVDNHVGVPGVIVTASGTATNRSFDFAFINLKGEQGIQGIQGPKGEKGDQGMPGYSPVRGTDYWTATDEATIIAEAIAGVLAIYPAAEEVLL